MTQTQAETAFIAGGSGVIGSAIARRLAEDGVNLTLAYRSNAAKTKALADELTHLGVKVDAVQLDLEDAVAVRSAVDHAVERYGRLDRLVYAAGPSIKFNLINQIEPDEWSRVLNGDAGAAFNLVAAALPH